MADKWFGKFIKALKENHLFEDTLILFTSDHGHMLGEHKFTGKNIMHTYNEIAHIPFIAHLPKHECAGERRVALTQNIDLMPTILSHFKVDIPETVKGYSLLNLLRHEGEKTREAVIYGAHGTTVNVTDGCYTYFRAAVREDNQPCFNYCITPTSLWRYLGVGDESHIECGRFLQRTQYPQFKIPSREKRSEHMASHLLYDIKEDYEQEIPLDNPVIENNMIEKMIKCMKETQSPVEQFQRLGL